MGEKREYAISRYENNVDFIPEYVEGEFEIPFILPEPYEPTEFIPFNMASTCYKKGEVGIHFFIHDYQFQRLWMMREKYRNLLPQFKAVMTPDFSMFTDLQVMIQRWNHYRKNLMGAWMQSIGCTVYPTITWSDEQSYKWCFEGEPHYATVCVSSIGTQKNAKTKELFLSGYEQMMARLHPDTILFYGKVPEECTGNIVILNSFQDRIVEV